MKRLSELGINGVWLHVVLRDLAPGGADFPEFGEGHQRRLANLRALVQRAKRFGIGIYLYMNEPRAMPLAFFDKPGRDEMAGVREGDFRAMCTSNPKVRRWLTDALAHVFQNVPDLAGVFTITASENLTNCATHWRWTQCPRCKNRSDAEIIAEVNALIAEGVHRGNPKANVIAWDWGWNTHGETPELIAMLPKSVRLMSVSEWSLPLDRGGVKSKVGEYCLSAVGPGPRALNQWKSASPAGGRRAGCEDVRRGSPRCRRVGRRGRRAFRPRGRPAGAQGLDRFQPGVSRVSLSRQRDIQLSGAGWAGQSLV